MSLGAGLGAAMGMGQGRNRRGRGLGQLVMQGFGQAAEQGDMGGGLTRGLGAIVRQGLRAAKAQGQQEQREPSTTGGGMQPGFAGIREMIQRRRAAGQGLGTMGTSRFSNALRRRRPIRGGRAGAGPGGGALYQ